MSEGEFSCVMKPQRKRKLRSKMVVVPFDGWGIELFPVRHHGFTRGNIGKRGGA